MSLDQQQWLKGLKTYFTGNWVLGLGAVGFGCSLWRLPPSWFRNDWSGGGGGCFQLVWLGCHLKKNNFKK